MRVKIYKFILIAKKHISHDIVLTNKKTKVTIRSNDNTKAV